MGPLNVCIGTQPVFKEAAVFQEFLSPEAFMVCFSSSSLLSMLGHKDILYYYTYIKMYDHCDSLKVL